MGTNYYLNRNVCPHCKREESRLHIGKSSAGWCFALRVHPDEGINELADWERVWSEPGNVIVDEYSDDPITPEDMRKLIAERSWKRSESPWGYRDWPDFYDRNGAVEGPHGLSRHAEFKGKCKHGAGTWDLLNYDFS